MAKIAKLAILLMAAGESRRLGQPKQLIELQQVPLLVRQSELALGVRNNAVNTPVFCILGFQAQQLRRLLPTSISVIESECWQQGLSSSIAAGIAELDKDIDAALIFLVDQWQLTILALQKLIAHWLLDESKIIIASQHTNENPGLRGPPVIFPKEYFSQLSQLTGDNGAKIIIEKNESEVVTIALSTAFTDLDTSEQLKAVEAIQSWPRI